MTKVKLGKYKHYKGNFYEVIGVAKHSETKEELVIYKGLYEDEEFGKNPTWARPTKIFLEKVEVNGKEIPRFEFVNE